MDNTDYDEEREVNIIANRKLKGSVMNIALPPNSEEQKSSHKEVNNKRKRSELDDPGLQLNRRERLNESIKNAFISHVQGHDNHRPNKRLKITENEEKEYNDSTNLTIQKGEEKECEDTRKRTLSISNFEPVMPKGRILTCKTFIHFIKNLK
jgi:hypothetical protein